MKGKLILENGISMEGITFAGDSETVVGEVVFNTSMTGYQEILTDPSYYGQIVVMTYPLIGNYGINFQDLQSKNIKVRGLITREICDYPSNFRREMSLDKYMKAEKIFGLEDIDTRHLTKIIRKKGTLKGILTSKNISKEKEKELFKNYSKKDFVKNVSIDKTYTIKGEGLKVGILDFGVKQNIIEELKKRNCEIKIYPYVTDKKDIYEDDLDLLILSNGPGDPKDLDISINNVRELLGKLPIAGICLGHQIISLAAGANTKKMKFGHRGGNHPVKDLKKNKVFITSQNHGYVVENKSLPKNIDITHINLNDDTIEGIESDSLKIKSVQYHPEASPGPMESRYIFDDFLKISRRQHDIK